MGYYDGPLDTELVSALAEKVDWEGGLSNYLFGYGGEVPKELQVLAQEAKQTWNAFEKAYESLLTQYGVSL